MAIWEWIYLNIQLTNFWTDVKYWKMVIRSCSISLVRNKLEINGLAKETRPYIYAENSTIPFY